MYQYIHHHHHHDHNHQHCRHHHHHDNDDDHHHHQHHINSHFLSETGLVFSLHLFGKRTSVDTRQVFTRWMPFRLAVSFAMLATKFSKNWHVITLDTRFVNWCCRMQSSLHVKTNSVSSLTQDLYNFVCLIQHVIILTDSFTFQILINGK